MKALILAAGFGTRLLPHTTEVPKPLFTLGSVTLLELAARKLIRAGCGEIWVNTHHLHSQVAQAVQKIQDRLGCPMHISHEEEILETGGAIAALKDAFQDSHFFVVNADVISDIDLEELARHHRQTKALATLALHHRPEFNKVLQNDTGAIEDFNAPGRGLAFTGIQILSPAILEHLPEEKVFSSIKLYQSLCHTGKIQGCVFPSPFWEDIGTPEAYRRTARHWLAAQTLIPESAFAGTANVNVAPLTGDGSDRQWFRATTSDKANTDSLILSDHGISTPGSDREIQARAFIAIGNHLHSQGVAVPRVLSSDPLSGLVALEDLGDTHLAQKVAELGTSPDPARLTALYTPVIDALVRFSQRGQDGFNTDWTCQTATYSRELILEMECRYFLNAFVKGICGVDTDFDDLADEFNTLADQALASEQMGLMHRDCQSRNIMIHQGTPWFIDFQSARLGPLEYDLASLLIDPYVCLPQEVQTQLLDHTLDSLNLTEAHGRNAFIRCYEACCITRNLQALGAFGFLSTVKGKPQFREHIPAALDGLKSRLARWEEARPGQLSRLNQLTQTLSF